MLMRFAGPLTALALFLAFPAPARAQAAVTTTDIQRLQDSITDAAHDVAQTRERAAGLASQLQSELDEARDELTYLRVKIRKNEPVERDEYAGLRDRIGDIRARARGEAAPSVHREGTYTPPAGISDTPSDGRDADRPVPTTGHSINAHEISVGTEFDVRLQNSLSSGTAHVEDRFEATTMVDLRDERGRVIAPSGSVMRGIVNSVHKATRTERKGSLTVAFDRVTIDGRTYPMRGTVTHALESEGIAGEKEKIGIGAGAGAVLGAILGGAKGALAGIVIGGGGAIAATEGKDVDLPAGTVLRVRLDSPLTLDSR
jgi:hypothetical protein